MQEKIFCVCACVSVVHIQIGHLWVHVCVFIACASALFVLVCIIVDELQTAKQT